jgi:acetyl esterase/lipase
MNCLRFLGVAALGLMAGAGCCHLPASSRAAKALPLPASVSAQFDYVRSQEFLSQRKQSKVTPQFVVQSVQWTNLAPVAGSNAVGRSITLDYFLPGRPGKHPVIMILPMLGGGYPLEKHFAVYFAKRGYAALIVHRERPPKDLGWEAIDAILKESVLDSRRAIDWIETRPELDAERIGIFGISMGGIKAALLAPIEPRVRAAVMGLAGGDLAYVLSYTTEHGISKRREAILREQSLTPIELRKKLSHSIQCEPEALAPYLDSHKVLLILGACDTVVPIKKGLELRRKMRKPETILLPTGHYSAILLVPYIQRQCFRFFERKMGPAAKEKDVH